MTIENMPAYAARTRNRVCGYLLTGLTILARWRRDRRAGNSIIRLVHRQFRSAGDVTGHARVRYAGRGEIAD
jgi:hypothetical protein